MVRGYGPDPLLDALKLWQLLEAFAPQNVFDLPSHAQKVELVIGVGLPQLWDDNKASSLDNGRMMPQRTASPSNKPLKINYLHIKKS